MLRKTIVTVVGSAVLGGLGVGYLALGPSASADRAAIVDDTTVDDSTVATATNDAPTPPTDAERDARHAAHLQEALAPLLADNTLTQAQIDKVIAALAAARPEGGNGPRGGGPGHGGPGHGGRGGPMGERRGEGLTVAAEAIGITVDALRTELQAGKTIAEVATANNVAPQAVIDALIASATTNVDQRVTDGDITAERATEIKANLVERTTRFVNEFGPKHRAGVDQPAPVTDDGGS